MKFQSKFLAVVLLLLVGAVEVAMGQSYQGGLRGAVNEVDGSVIPGAEVTLRNEETNATRTVVTNEAGEYAFANVLPGTYTVTAMANGHKKLESKGVRIGTQEFITLDLALEVGGITETVTVTNQAPLLETSNASVGTVLDRTELNTLPIVNRNPFSVSVTTPNVIYTGSPTETRQQDQASSARLSLGGGPRQTNNYTIDGVAITDLRNRSVIIPSIEALDEVKVQVNTYDAELGRTGGGVFNATAKSGSNDWHGSGLFQTRPNFATARSYFARQAGLPKPDAYYYLYGGSIGGPIIKNKTFFWASTENYKAKTSLNSVLFLPTARELSGDFSQTFDSQGRLVVIYDPLTTRPNPAGGFIRDPFPGNVIPAGRINPVSRALQSLFPKPTSGNSLSAQAILVNEANQAIGKVEHRFSEKYTLTGLYAFYRSQEPQAEFYGGNSPADPGDSFLRRRVDTIAINNIIAPKNNTVISLRYGWYRFKDNDLPNEFDPAQLGFSSNFISAIPIKKFPVFNISGYGRAGANTFGNLARRLHTYYGQQVNGSVSVLLGRHTFKYGADYRNLGLKLFVAGQSSGSFVFNSGFTQGPNPLVASTNSGNSLASFLLGNPASGDITVATRNNFFINYYGGYVQDDFRVTPNLTLNLGLRYEFEQGLREKNNNFTVGFDRDRPFPIQVPGLNLRGGLQYAGVDGYPTHQSDPSRRKFAPRVGFAWSINSKTVLRGGYGLLWAPHTYANATENSYGTRGFTAVTSYFASNDGGLTPCATCRLDNPFPNGIEQPRGSANGLLTGAGGTVNFIDQFRKSPYVHQYSVDLERQFGDIVVSIGYVGSRVEQINVGGTESNTVNINQLDPRFFSLGATLNDQVANPFFGNPAFGAFSRNSTIARGQLLRPFPQFGDILANQVSAGRSRYDSLVLKVERRFNDGLGLRANYTYSRLKDNIFGEINFLGNNSNAFARPLNNYDLDAEFGFSALDAPHRFNFVGTYELPFGKGKHWVSEKGFASAVLGGWVITAVGSYQSGYPILVVQNSNNSGLFGSFQRPNIVAGQNPATSGSLQDRLRSYLNPLAYSQAAPFTFGNAPRTDPRVRTPSQKTLDAALQKTIRFTESKNLVVRGEVINVLNIPIFRAPATVFGRADFGRITEVGGFPRLLQVTVRFGF